MRTQVRDLMEKHCEELRRAVEKHESEMSEKEQVMLTQLEAARKSSAPPSPGGSPEDTPDHTLTRRITELEGIVLRPSQTASASPELLR